MSNSDFTQLPTDLDNPYKTALEVFLRGISIVLLLIGLRHWVYIAGVFSDPGWNLVSMSSAWRFVTVNLAVLDLVAAVGLWMRVSWGHVLWVYAAAFEIVMHTVFAQRFGLDLPVLAFHIVALAGSLTLLILSKRYEDNAPAAQSVTS